MDISLFMGNIFNMAHLTHKGLNAEPHQPGAGHLNILMKMRAANLVVLNFGVDATSDVTSCGPVKLADLQRILSNIGPAADSILDPDEGTVRRFLEKQKNNVTTVVFCTASTTDTEIYKRLLPLYFPRDKHEEQVALSKLPADVGDENGETIIDERKTRIKPLPKKVFQDHLILQLIFLSAILAWFESATSSYKNVTRHYRNFKT